MAIGASEAETFWVESRRPSVLTATAMVTARLVAVAAAGHLPTAPTPPPGT
jgi:hypothetical protein